jgi:hypothetical protein
MRNEASVCMIQKFSVLRKCVAILSSFIPLDNSTIRIFV